MKSGGMGAVYRHELRLFLYSPLTYLFQTGFVLSLAACVFLIADFYNSDEATVRSMLVFLPWVAQILVPALAMRSFADELNDRSVELMLTLPLGLTQVVAGKFLAGFTVLLVTLLFTAPFAATVFYLGEPDVGVMVASYLAAALLLGMYYAVALFASSLAREPVGAFVVGVTLLFALLLFGWDAFTRFLDGFLSPAWVQSMASFSPKTWLDSISRGLVEVSAIGYFVLVIVTSLFATALVLRVRRIGGQSVARTAAVIAAGLVALALVSVAIAVLARVPSGVDVTAEREYTIHPGTQLILDRLPQGVEARFFWSADETSVPVAIKSHARRVKELLSRLAERSNGRFVVRSENVTLDSDTELAALNDGIRRVPMSSGDHFYFGASLRHGDRVSAIPYFDIRRDRLTEYDIATALNSLSKTRVPRIGLLSPLLPPTAAHNGSDGLSFVSELRRAYDLALIPYFSDDLPAGLDVLVVMDASVLKRKMLYAIDQFVMAGGSLIVMMDPYLRSHPASNQVSPKPSAELNDISDLLLRYGVRYLGARVVGDATIGAPVADRDQVRMSYPFWMRLREESLSSSHPVTASLNDVFLVEPGSLLLEDENRAHALVTTTEQSGLRDRDGFAQGEPRELVLDFKPDGERRVLAAVLRGEFESAFDTAPAGVEPASHRERSQREATVFVVADVDWLFDPFALQTSDVGGQTVVRPLNDNVAFFLNMVEYAGGDPALVSIRSRGRLQRPFTRVAQLFQAAEQAYRDEEMKASSQVTELESQIVAIAKEAGVNSLEQLPTEFREKVQGVQADLIAKRKTLREIRRRIREQVDHLGRRLTILNLLAGPVLVLLFAAGVRLFRTGASRQ